MQSKALHETTSGVLIAPNQFYCSRWITKLVSSLAQAKQKRLKCKWKKNSIENFWRISSKKIVQFNSFCCLSATHSFRCAVQPKQNTLNGIVRILKWTRSPHIFTLEVNCKIVDARVSSYVSMPQFWLYGNVAQMKDATFNLTAQILQQIFLQIHRYHTP